MKTKCAHHFILPEPDGRESIGVCKYCNFEQLHYNSIDSKFNSWRGKGDMEKDQRRNDGRAWE